MEKVYNLLVGMAGTGSKLLSAQGLRRRRRQREKKRHVRNILDKPNEGLLGSCSWAFSSMIFRDVPLRIVRGGFVCSGAEKLFCSLSVLAFFSS